jgi:ribosomal protein L21E
MSADQHYDLIVRNATIIDGARTPRFQGEIGVCVTERLRALETSTVRVRTQKSMPPA